MKNLLDIISSKKSEIRDVIEIIYVVAFVVLMFTGRFGAILSSIVFMTIAITAGFSSNNDSQRKHDRNKRRGR